MENFGDEHHDSLERQKQKLRSTYGICLLLAVVFQLGALVVIFWWQMWIYITLQVLAFFFWMIAVVCRMKLRRLFFAQVMQGSSSVHHHTDVVYVQQPQQAQLYAEPTAAYTSQPAGSFAMPAPVYTAQPSYAPAPYTAAPQPTYAFDASQPPAQQGTFVV